MIDRREIPFDISHSGERRNRLLFYERSEYEGGMSSRSSLSSRIRSISRLKFCTSSRKSSWRWNCPEICRSIVAPRRALLVLWLAVEEDCVCVGVVCDGSDLFGAVD